MCPGVMVVGGKMAVVDGGMVGGGRNSETRTSSHAVILASGKVSHRRAEAPPRTTNGTHRSPARSCAPAQARHPQAVPRSTEQEQQRRSHCTLPLPPPTPSTPGHPNKDLRDKKENKTKRKGAHRPCHGRRRRPRPRCRRRRGVHAAVAWWPHQRPPRPGGDGAGASGAGQGDGDGKESCHHGKKRAGG